MLQCCNATYVHPKPTRDPSIIGFFSAAEVWIDMYRAQKVNDLNSQNPILPLLYCAAPIRRSISSPLIVLA